MRTKPLAIALVAVSSLLLLEIASVVLWWAVLRLGFADKMICLDARTKSADGVYRTYEGDSGCVSHEICVDLEASVHADRIRATDCRARASD
jgi:hypothetical protein